MTGPEPGEDRFARAVGSAADWLVRRPGWAAISVVYFGVLAAALFLIALVTVLVRLIL